MDYQMGLGKLRNLLPPDQKLLALNGPWLEFTRRPKAGATVSDFAKALQAEGLHIDPALAGAVAARIPGQRLYAHQETAIRAMLRGKNIVLPHPTGSGKTEAFVVPTLQYLLEQLRTERKDGLGCLMIFPMKALENDQRDRLKELLHKLMQAHGTRIPYLGVYDGDTPSQADFDRLQNNDRRALLQRYREKCPQCAKETLRYNMGAPTHLLRCEADQDEQGNPIGCGYPDDIPQGIPYIRTTRDDMRNTPAYPTILITNPEALDYGMQFPENRALFNTKMPRVVVVIDEAHAYAGAAATNLRFLISRLEEKLRSVNGRDVKVQYVVSSATLDDPAAFAKKLVPWAEFEVIPFTQRESPFTAPQSGAPRLSGLTSLDTQNLHFVLDAYGKPKAALAHALTDGASVDEVVTTLEQLQIVKVEDGKLVAPDTACEQAWHAYTVDRKDEAVERLTNVLKTRLSANGQVAQLYDFVTSGPKRLDEIVSWWTRTFPGPGADHSAEDVTALVAIGRRLGLWEERWHLFVRPPRGVAACTSASFHAQAMWGDEPLSPACAKCVPARPVLEVWTCTSCEEIYYGYMHCEKCGQLAASREASCGHAELAERMVRKEAATDALSLDAVDAFGRRREDSCEVCSGEVFPVRRRTDLIIQMAVSLLGWHTDERHRKFLLFADGRAATERIGRDFNNLERDIWAERLLMDLMMRDPAYDRHESRSFDEMRQKLFLHLRKPYNDALLRVWRPFERQQMDQNLTMSAFRALSRSSQGRSRLFKHGLLAFSFQEIQDRIVALGLETVVPRIVDLLRLHAPYGRGIKRDKLIRRFTDGHPNFEAAMQALAGTDYEHVRRGLNLLQEAMWIRPINRNGEITYFLNEGDAESSDDPFDVARDYRRLVVPVNVSRCNRCGVTSWYPLAVCSRCGQDTVELTHDQLVKTDYFAGVLIRQPRPVIAAVHRAGLEPLERRLVEDRFRSDRNSIHFLCATPTLELGIDVGALNFVLLARVPPTKANYIQRVGRAGRRQREGAICVTFAYPSPIDTFYFRNPQPLVRMRTNRVPVQRLALERMPALLWSVIVDTFVVRAQAAVVSPFEAKVPSRDFLEGNTITTTTALRQEFDRLWPELEAAAKRVATRALAQDDYVKASGLVSVLRDLHAVVKDDARFSQDFLSLAAYQEEKDQIDHIHAEVTQRIADLRRKKPKTKADERDLERLVNEDKSLQEFRRRHMMSSPLLLYLHGFGTLSSTRGIGASVPVYDIQRMESAIDDRAADQAVYDRFPAALVSRQGSIYRVRTTIYNPIDQPRIRRCHTCQDWLDDAADRCDNHPGDGVVEETLMKPVVSIAELTRYRSRETRGTREQLLKPIGAVPETPLRDFGGLRIRLSAPHDLKIAIMCQTFDVYDEGTRSRAGEIIRACKNCKAAPPSDGDCCATSEQEPIIQGTVYKTRGVRFEVDRPTLDKKLEAAQDQINGTVPDPARAVTQSLTNAFLNGLSLLLDVEPSTFDGRLDPSANNAFWIYEPTSGGAGLLDDLFREPNALEQLHTLVSGIVGTKPGDHECSRYCDACLIVPRYSHDELRDLHRPLLEKVLT